MWEAYPAQMRTALAGHNAILNQVITDHDGVVVTSRGEGDSFFAVFASVISAVEAAATAQRRLSSEPWPEGCAINVRMALHSGEADFRDGEYHGHAAINRCARLRAAAHGGQMLVSRATRDLVLPHLQGGLELRDLGEHRLRDLRTAERIYQLGAPGLASDFAPILTLSDRTSNLPVQTTSFVGRDDELRMTKELVSRHRVVTLLGAGGSGKTRLALQAAAAMTGDFPDGTWLVGLAALSDADLVASQVAAALRLAELDIETLRPKTLLIVLDNCEHLVEACARVVARLVEGCPGIAVLATSREPLNVPGEQLMRLPALKVEDAVQLFDERAALVRADFVQSWLDDPAIEAICRRLDGIPLAIELAAARVRAMTPAEVLERLQDRFTLLRSKGPALPERHQTLRATVAWSYDLLTHAEQSIFRQLSVFSGGWFMASAAAVCTDRLFSEADVEDVLMTLIDKSLVLVSGLERSRYWMLETLREYARERLKADDMLAELQRRHGEHFLARTSAPDWPTETWWIDRRVRDVLPDLDNLRTALEWSRGQAPEVGLGLVVGAAPLWMASGRLTEGKHAITEALERDPGPSPLHLRALEHKAWLSLEHGDLQTAVNSAHDALRMAEELGGQKVAAAQALLGFAALRDRDFQVAGDWFARSLQAYRAGGNLVGVAQVLNHQAVLAMWTGDAATAESLFDEVVSMGGQAGDGGLVDYALLSAIPIMVDQGRLADARDRWRAAYNRSGDGGFAIMNLAFTGFAAATASAERRAYRAVVISEVALSLKAETGWQDDLLLNWYWRTMTPAYEALSPASLAEARAAARNMSLAAAMAYAASDDD